MKGIITTKLTNALDPSLLDVVDNSWQHAKHREMLNKPAIETHFNIIIISKHFIGKSLIERHKIIYKILQDELQYGSIHALSITASPPQI